MKEKHDLSRRAFLGAIAAIPIAPTANTSKIPVGLELYSVRDALSKDLMGTVRSVAKMGYQCVEFFGPYSNWTPGEARRVRGELDTLGIKCFSTHNALNAFTPKGIGQAIELNNILGTRYVVNSSPGDPRNLDDWKRVAETLNNAHETLRGYGLLAGYHNHNAEWRLVEGKKPMEVLAAALDKSIMLQLDVGTCVEAGSDPVGWIKENPGRIRSLHLKDWSPQHQFRVLFGEGIAPWKQILTAAENGG